MGSWFEHLTNVQQIFAVMAIPATVVLVLQTILLLFGLGAGHDLDHGADAGGHDFGHDLDHDAHDFGHDYDHDAHAFGHAGHGEHGEHDGAHHVEGLRVLTVRGLVAFFAVGGWVGIASVDLGVPSLLAVLFAFLAGAVALVLVAWLLALSLRLQDEGNINLANAVGQTAQVYIRIPPQGEGYGKVTLNLQERFSELEAVTSAKVSIPPGSTVRVTGTRDANTLIVEPAGERQAPPEQT